METPSGLPWNDEADSLLIKQVEKHSKDNNTLINWDIVKEAFPARTKSACRGRWDRLKHDKLQGGRTLNDIDVEDHPTYQQLFEVMRDHPRTLEWLANKFDRSPKAIQEKLNEMEGKSYNLVISKQSFAVVTSTAPAAPSDISITELAGKSINLAIASDWHAGSKHSQPTRLKQFIKYAYEEYDVRHFFVPGDPMDGAYVYGPKHLDNLIPQVRPLNRKRVWMTVDAQTQLADSYAPQLPDAQYYIMGGNHDKSLFTNSGLDAIRILCDRRDDFNYGGYNVWAIRLTEKSYIRLMHPTGGVAYARSYKLQKGIENLAFEALRQAMIEDTAPMTSILVMGHFHLTNHSPEPPLHGVLAGCFQGSTDYLKTKNLVPHIAGLIIEIQIGKYGKLSQVAHRPIYFEEITDDWKDHWTPQIDDPDMTADQLETLFSFKGKMPNEGTETNNH